MFDLRVIFFPKRGKNREFLVILGQFLGQLAFFVKIWLDDSQFNIFLIFFLFFFSFKNQNSLKMSKKRGL